MDDAVKPKCMTNLEFEDWTSLNLRLVVKAMIAATPCQDCEMEFAAEQRDIDMCDGIPGTRLVQTDDLMPAMAEFVALGYSAQRAAAMLGATRKRLDRMAREREAVAMFEAGMTKAAIAEAMGLTQGAINKYIASAKKVA